MTRTMVDSTNLADDPAAQLTAGVATVWNALAGA